MKLLHTDIGCHAKLCKTLEKCFQLNSKRVLWLKPSTQLEVPLDFLVSFEDALNNVLDLEQLSQFQRYQRLPMEFSCFFLSSQTFTCRVYISFPDASDSLRRDFDSKKIDMGI